MKSKFLSASQVNVDNSNRLFEKHEKSHLGQFCVSCAEKLPYEDSTFDRIAGFDILHHVNIEESIKECYRVLRPGGKAYFREPVEVPFLDAIRNTRLVRYVMPKVKSFERHITEDERKLTKADYILLKKSFPKIITKRFLFLSRFNKFFRSYEDPRPSFLEKIDYYFR